MLTRLVLNAALLGTLLIQFDASLLRHTRNRQSVIRPQIQYQNSEVMPGQ